MIPINQSVFFDDECSLQDALSANGIGAQAIHGELERLLDSGSGITAIVPGMPARAIVRKCVIERITGMVLAGPPLVAITFK